MTALDLGGTLFLPVTHKSLLDVVSGEKYPRLKSVLLDLEDSLDDLDEGLNRLREMLESYKKNSLLVFVRPRNVDVLKQVLGFKNIEKIDGFILPKFSLTNASDYLELLKKTSFKFMPSIEGSELFEQTKLIQLKNILLPCKEHIPVVRFGLEDMLRQLRMKRSCEDTLFDYAVTSSVIGSFIAVFKSAGFDVSGGVYPCFKKQDGFVQDVLRDMKEGLVSKTIIHPNQIEIINQLYKVQKYEYEQALEISDSKLSVFNQDGTMAETKTMNPYSQEILKRVKVYGLVT